MANLQVQIRPGPTLCRERAKGGSPSPQCLASFLSGPLMVPAGWPKKILRVRLDLSIFPLPILIITCPQGSACPFSNYRNTGPSRSWKQVEGTGPSSAQPPLALTRTSWIHSDRQGGGRPVPTGGSLPSVCSLSVHLLPLSHPMSCLILYSKGCPQPGTFKKLLNF